MVLDMGQLCPEHVPQITCVLGELVPDAFLYLEPGHKVLNFIHLLGLNLLDDLKKDACNLSDTQHSCTWLLDPLQLQEHLHVQSLDGLKCTAELVGSWLEDLWFRVVDCLAI